MAISLGDILHSRPAVTPQIYGYTLPTVPDHDGYIKIGYTDRGDVEKRINEQLHVAGIPHETIFTASAMRSDGTCFTDKDVHRLLKRKGFKRMIFDGNTNNEWFNCSLADLKTAVREVRNYARYDGNRNIDFSMRLEQQMAVNQTADYFKKIKIEEPGSTPKYLWNAKMRFGKTFATYQLAKKMQMKRVLILTFKPAVESAWQEDLMRHVDFGGWQFVSNKEAKFDATSIDQQYLACNKNDPIVVFGSFQDLLGTNEAGGIKAKNEFVHLEDWDMVVFDEYHFGAWRDNAKKLFEKEDEENTDFDYEAYQDKEAGNAINETWLPIKTKHYLYLSGTPFRAISSGEFLEEQIFNWTYSDEQAAKASWDDSKGNSPYAALPKMVMLTYKIPDSITHIAVNEGYDEFDINEFFKAEFDKKNGGIEESRFVYEEYVQKWLDLIQGKGNFVDGLQLGSDKPPMPYSDTTLLNVLSHTLWFLPNVASCYAMYNLLRKAQNKFFKDYEIVVCAGTKAGIGLDALKPVEHAIADPLKTKTITLSCGKLTTGVTVKPWSGVFMLRNLKSPETYFQTAFRVQSPWEIKDDLGNNIIMKEECYVFDFALERALRQISDYSIKLSSTETSPEQKVAEFINFLPVLAFDGAGMNQISASDILDITFSGTTATLLAKRWQTALLVHVDNDTLKKLQGNPQALAALQNLEGFRKLNEQIETIINKSEKVKAGKGKDKKPSQKEKRELTQEEKEMKSLRKQVQENLLKLAARIPAFMYLTDFREQCIKDVITQIEPDLFKKVTGLNVDDFNILCDIGLFDPEKMNQGIFGFRRYENSSLSYTGINMHENENVGGWDTVLTREEYNELYMKQQAAMTDFVEIMVPSDASMKEETKGKVIQIPKKEVVYDISPISAGKAAEISAGVVSKDLVVKEREQDWSQILEKIVVGTKVKHKKFGEGEAVKFDAYRKYITVRFEDGEKRFGFVESFVKGFLEL